jgi:predicted Zn-dependent peptidase
VRTLSKVYLEQMYFNGVKRFTEGRVSLQDDAQKGRPSAPTTEESTEVTGKCLAADARRNVRYQQRDSMQDIG